MNDISADVTWGDGPDILLSVNGRVLLLEDPIELQNWTHGICKHVQLDLTAEEALELATRLQIAAARVEELEAAARDLENK